MDTRCTLSRRGFLSTVAAAGAATAVLGAEGRAEPENPPASKIIGFTKPFQTAGPAETADIVAEIGWDGIECPVRPKGQIEPERVEDDLPKMAEALRKVGREVTLLTTGIRAVNPLTEKVLRTASKLGIRRYRLAFWSYSPDRPIPDQIAEVRAASRELAALNKELGICGGHQNHSGSNCFGAPIWDIHEAIRDCDPRYMGICFDIGHATIEGGLAWPIHARLMRPSTRPCSSRTSSGGKAPRAGSPTGARWATARSIRNSSGRSRSRATRVPFRSITNTTWAPAPR